MVYDLYPGVDEDFLFPPEVREALAGSDEMLQQFLLDNAAVAASGPLALQKLTKVNAGAGPKAMTIPDGLVKGQTVVAEKVDPTNNYVTITGKIRSVVAATEVLSLQNESAQFVWTGTYWEPVGRPKDKVYSLNGKDGLIFDGVTVNSATVLQGYLNEAGTGSLILFKGVLLVDLPVTTPTYSILKSTTGKIAGAGFTSHAEIKFPTLTGVQTGISLGAGAGLEELLVRGPGFGTTCVGVRNAVSGGSSLSMRRVQLYEWGKALCFGTLGATNSGVFYGYFADCEFRFNGIGVYVENACNNVTFVSCKFSCRSTTYPHLYGAGVMFGPSVGSFPFTFFGTSIEGYGGVTAPAIGLAYGTICNIWACYFESSDRNAASTAYPLGQPNFPLTGSIPVNSGSTGCTINSLGNIVSLQEGNRYINGGGATSGRLIAHGDKIVCNDQSTTVPIGYVWGTAKCDVSGNDWEMFWKTGSTAHSISQTAGHNFPILSTVTTPTAWAATTAYTNGTQKTMTVGAVTVSVECVIAGTSGAALPTLPTATGQLVVDGTVTWECVSLTATVPPKGFGFFQGQVMVQAKVTATWNTNQIIDFSKGSIAQLNLIGNIVSLTFVGGLANAIYTFIAVQSAGGPFTWAGSAATIKWEAGAMPAMPVGASKRLIRQFFCDGTNYWEMPGSNL